MRNQIDILPAEIGLKNVKDTNAGSLCDADKPMRYGLAVSGLVSGEFLFANKTSLKILSTCYHSLVCIVVAVNILLTVLTSWDSGDGDLFYLFFKLTAFGWRLQLACCVCLTFYNCYQKSQLKAYYDQLAEVEQLLSSLGANIRNRRIRNASIIATVFGWTLVMANIGLEISGFINSREQDIIYGNSLRDLVKSDTAFIFLQRLSFLAKLLTLSHWVLVVIYYFVLSFTVLTVMEDYNRKLEREVSGSRRAIFHDINRYRVTHLELCDLISKANRCLSPIIGIHVAGNVVILLLILYLLASAISDPESNLVLSFLSWILTGGATLLTYIAVAAKLSHEVRITYSQPLEHFKDLESMKKRRNVSEFKCRNA